MRLAQLLTFSYETQFSAIMNSIPLLMFYFILCVYQDFVRFPWKNQPSLNLHAMPATPSASSGGSTRSGLSHVYGSTSRQLNQDIYSSGQEGQGFSAVPQPMDLISEEMDCGSQQFLR